MPVLEKLYSHAPDRTAAIVGGTPITYGQLCADTRAMARWLASHGLEPGMRIEIHPEDMLSPTYWDWIMHLGAIEAGLVHSTQSLSLALVQSGAVGRKQAVIGAVENWEPTPGYPCKKLPFAPQSLAPLAEQITIANDVVLPEGREVQAARLLQTSGTTGQPKLVRWDAAILAGRVEQLVAAGDITGSTVLMSGLGYRTTAGFRNPIATWQAGGHVILRSAGAKQDINKAAIEKSNLIISSPLHLRTLLEALGNASFAGKAKRVVKLFGGRLTQALRDKTLKQVAGRLIVSYGSTETGSVATGDASVVDRHPGAVGFALPGAIVEVAGPGGVTQPAGTQGLIRIKTDVMCHGYAVHLNAAGRSPFRDGWFYPGDLAIMYEDGLIAICGRVSETINVEGVKLSAVDLETQFASLEGIDDVCALSMPLDQQDTLAIAIACAETVDLVQLRLRIAALLPRHMHFALVRVATIPRNAMGKIMRIPLAERVKSIIERAPAQLQALEN